MKLKDLTLAVVELTQFFAISAHALYETARLSSQLIGVKK